MSDLTLHDKQVLFMRLLPRLIDFAFAQGFELTEGEAFRTQQQAQWNAEHHLGIARSLHGLRLAEDFNLFKNGIYLTASEDYQPLGAFWKTLHPLCSWGGDFSKPDGNHFSIEHEGVR